VAIRPFDEGDYAAMAYLHNTNYADFADDMQELRLRDQRLPEYCLRARWVAESGGRVVGFGEYVQNQYLYHPRKFSLEVAVDPSCYGQRIGSRLYTTVMAGIESFDPISVEAWSRADMPRLVGFLEHRGFVPNTELFTSTLSLSEFAPSVWAAYVVRLLTQGLEVRSLEDLGTYDPHVRRKIYDMWRDIRRDMPLPPGEAQSELSFDEYWDQIDMPSLLAAGFFIAVDGDRYVGTSQLFRATEPDDLRTGLTGVVRTHRRRGIAMGLKIQALTFAKTLGVRRVSTDNSAENVGMLAINQQLGFARNPAWIRYLKTFDS
jgi:GNAT superfamily N-acetyltransferase